MAAKKESGGRREELLKELRALLKQVDEEGLAFLAGQAATLIHNARIEELNRIRESAPESDARPARARRRSGSGGKSGAEVFFRKSGRPGGYFLQIDGVRSIMDEDEVLALAEIAHKARSRAEGTQRLYRWLETHRDEVLIESGMGRTGSRIEGLYSCLRKDFAIRK